MDEALIRRVEESFTLLQPHGDEVVEKLYTRLFMSHPQIAPLFHSDLREQKAKLLSALAIVVRKLREPAQLRQILLALGAQHASYAVKPQYYAAVQDAMLAAMADVAGNDWNAQLAQDWRLLLTHVSNVMLEGQSSVEV